MKILKLVLFFYILALTPIRAQSVNIRNGNMFISYSDVELNENHPMDFCIERTYNSISTAKGIFGVGWISNYETYILVIPGGGAALYYGGNNMILYEPRQWDRPDIAVQVDKLVAEATKKGEVKSSEKISILKNSLLNNQELRISNFRNYVIDNPKEKLRLTAGKKLISLYGGNLFLEALEDGFKLEGSNARTQFFDVNGRLVKEEDKEGNFISFSYDDKSQLDKISDNLGNHLIFSFKDKKVKSIEVKQIDSTVKKATYIYDNLAQTLISSTDIGNNHYVYEWDNVGGLTKIKYEDGREAIMTYDPISYKCTSVTRKNGIKYTFEYPEKSVDEYGTVYTSYDSLGIQLKKVSNWYVYKTNDLGKKYMYKRNIIEDKDSTYYVYKERFSKPDTVYVNQGIYYTFNYTTTGGLKNINENGVVLVSVDVKDEKILSLKTADHAYVTNYEKKKIIKLIAEDGTEISLPIKNTEDDPKGYKADLLKFMKTFVYTDLWDDLSSNLYLIKPNP